jgi:neurofibromin 1
MTPWLLNLVRFCKHNDDAKRQRVSAILDKLITMTINEKQMYPSIQAKIWGSLGQVSHHTHTRSQTLMYAYTPVV